MIRASTDGGSLRVDWAIMEVDKSGLVFVNLPWLRWAMDLQRIRRECLYRKRLLFTLYTDLTCSDLC